MRQSELTTLYEQDFQRWLEETTNCLKNRDFESIDLQHLIEELNDLGSSSKAVLESNLAILLAHLLKLTVQVNAPDTMKVSWYNSIDEHRLRVKRQLKKNPSLKSYWDTALLESYPDARKLAIKEGQRAKFGVTIYSESLYPSTCPFSQEQILNDDFYGIF
jgi:hypothetical protein